MCNAKKNGRAPFFKMNLVCTALLAWGLTSPAMAQTAAAPGSASAGKVNINEYLVRGNTVLSATDIEQAVTPFLGPEKTLQDVEAARDALLAAYQAKGYQSVYVDLPEQQVEGGVVLLQVAETKVGRVRVVGTEYTSPLEVRNKVSALQEGQVPDFNKAQVELTALNNTPKRQVTPLVKQGAIAGTMDVDLKVDDKNPWRASLGLNNDRSADTKPLRATASIGHDNLWQLGHSASLSFYGTPQEMSQSKVFSGSYNAPLPNSNWALELSGYRSDSSVATIGGTTVLGKGHSIGLKATYTIPNTENWWHTLSAGVDFRSNEEAVRVGISDEKVPLRYAPITLAYSGFVQLEKSYHSMGLSFVTGTSSFFGYGSDVQAFDNKRYEAKPSFMVIKGDIASTYKLPYDMQLAARLSAQVTDSPLVSAEQMSAGGMYSVRGYMSSEITGDYGATGSLELRSQPFSVGFVENLRLYTFADGAKLRLRDPLPEQESNFWVASVGVGSSFNLGEKIAARVDFGYPLKTAGRTTRYKPLVNFSLNANY